MATELGQAFVQIVPSARGISGSIQKIMDGEGASAGASGGSKLVGKLKGVIAAAGIGATLKKSLDIGGALEQSFGGLDTIYGDASSAAKAYAKEAYQAGISANSYAEQAVSFGAALKQAFGGDTKKAAEAANTAIMDMTDNAAKMGTPIENIQNAYQGFAKQNYTMLDNLKLGYGGTKQEMERLLADATKLSGVEYNIDNLGDVYDAIHVIQGDLGLTGVAAAEAAETFSGSFGAMKAAAENLLGSMMTGDGLQQSIEALGQTTVTFIGGNLIPAIGRILSSLPQVFMGAFDNLYIYGIQGMNKLATAIKQGASTAIPNALKGILNFSELFRSRAGSFINVGLNLIKTIADGIIQNIPVMIETIPTIISNFAGVINDNAPKVISTALSIMKNLAVGLIKAVPVLIKNIPKILKAIWDVFTAFQWLNLGKTLINGISKGLKNLGGIKGAGKKIVEGIKSILSKGWEAVKAAASKSWAAIANTIVQPIESLKGILTKIWSAIKSSVTTQWNAIKAAISKAVDGIKSVITTVFNAIKTVITTYVNGWKTVITTVWNAIKTVVTTAVNALKTVITTVFNAIKTFITSVVNGWKLIITATWNAIKTAVTTVITAIKTTITNVFNAVKTTIGTIFGSIRNTAATVWNNIKIAITTPINNAKDTVARVSDAIKTKVSGAFSGIASKVRTAFNSVKEAITGPLDSAKTKVSGIIEKIKGYFPLSIGKIFSNLKLPHISVSGGSAPFGIGGKGSLPKFSVSWYKKAEDNPYMFSKATLFGAGEGTQDEILYGRKSLMRDISAAADSDRTYRVLVEILRMLSTLSEQEKSIVLNNREFARLVNEVL